MVEILALTLSSYKILGKLLNLSMPQFLKKCAHKKIYVEKLAKVVAMGLKGKGWKLTSSKEESICEFR